MLIFIFVLSRKAKNSRLIVVAPGIMILEQTT